MRRQLPLYVLLLGTSAPAAEPTAFTKFADGYYAELFAWDPNQATYAGVHDHDDKLADLTAAAFARRAEAL